MNRFSLLILAAVFSMLFGVDTSARVVTGKVTCGQENLAKVVDRKSVV